MRISRRTLEYVGVADPATPEEIRIEILGLRNAIRQAEELISRHEQAMEIAAIMEREMPEEVPEEIHGQPVELPLVR
jgi:hypothetical protein